MIDLITGRILRPIRQFAYGVTKVLVVAALTVMIIDLPLAVGQRAMVDPETDMTSFIWDFSRADDPEFLKFPHQWKRIRDVGFPRYVESEITARDPDFETRMLSLDTMAVRWWKEIHRSVPALPALPPSIADALVDRYLRIELDGGQFEARSPEIPVSRKFQYRFSCQIATKDLKHDSASAEFLFLDQYGSVLETFSTGPVTGTIPWTTLTLPPVQPPYKAASMQVRLKVLRGDDGLEDIYGRIGFDNVRIEQLPQLDVTTDQSLGVYQLGQPITASAKILGLPTRTSDILFTLLDHNGVQIGQVKRQFEIIGNSQNDISDSNDRLDPSAGTSVHWSLPPLDPGFYRVTASIDGQRVTALASETTFVVIDHLQSKSTHGSFGWTLPQGRQGVAPRDIAPWLAGYGVEWVKYPCWLAPDDIQVAEETASIFSRLQDQGIETIAVLDAPPESQLALYELRGRRDLVAAQLFRNESTWKPLLEPVMTRMTLKVRRWQLGADRDHSFLGRPRLNELITEISTGLQGFGQPIDVAISWPWDESQFRDGKSSWQAECRSSVPSLSAEELDAYLSLGALDNRSESPNTWVLIDPISAKQYDQATRIQDLVLRMAMVRSHRVQAAFVSDPRDSDHGLLRPDGRPDELLLPWRTTSMLIGNLRKAGSLSLRGGTNNSVFVGDDRAVLMLWSTVPGQERLFLGKGAKSVDVWGRVTDLPIDFDGNQPGQVVHTGPIPIFVVGADPSLLRFRMSVVVQPSRLDSLIGRDQPLTVSLTNPTDESLVGDLQILSPETWTIEKPKRQWQALSGQIATEAFKVSLSNTAMVGEYEVPVQFDLDTTPPKRITEYRTVTVGPEGIEIDTKSRLLNRGELLVQIEVTNHSESTKSFDCRLFPPPGHQFQERVMTILPGATVRREFYFSDAQAFLGQLMTLRAVEQDGPRVINYRFRIRR